MEKIVKINKKLLTFRDQAQALAKTARATNLSNLTFDFTNVEFISRSFMDEFLNIQETLSEKYKNVKIESLKPELRQFMAQVQKSKAKIRAQVAAALK